MKDTSIFNPTILMWVGPSASRYQFAAALIAGLSKRWRIIMSVTQNITHWLGYLLNQARRDFRVCRVGHGQFGGQRNPQRADRDGQMQLPSIPPAVPARLRPTRLCINRSMWNFAFFFGFFVPDTAAGIEFGAINGSGVTAVSPSLEDNHQMSTQVAYQLWQGRRQLRQPSFPSAPGRKLSRFVQQSFQLLGDRVLLLKKSQQRISGVESANNHNQQGFQD